MEEYWVPMMESLMDASMVVERVLRDSEVNSTQWSQAYSIREGGRGVSIC